MTTYNCVCKHIYVSKSCPAHQEQASFARVYSEYKATGRNSYKSIKEKMKFQLFGESRRLDMPFGERCRARWDIRSFVYASITQNAFNIIYWLVLALKTLNLFSSSSGA